METVTISLETYNQMKAEISTLKQLVKEKEIKVPVFHPFIQGCMVALTIALVLIVMIKL